MSQELYRELIRMAILMLITGFSMGFLTAQAVRLFVRKGKIKQEGAA